MRIFVALSLAICGLSLFPNSSPAASPEETVDSVKLCLEEALANPAKQIPEKMLSEAYAVAIFPNVIKVGFIGAVRRGHGVVLIRDKEGDWGLPQFVTITGGSVLSAPSSGTITTAVRSGPSTASGEQLTGNSAVV